MNNADELMGHVEAYGQACVLRGILAAKGKPTLSADRDVSESADAIHSLAYSMAGHGSDKVDPTMPELPEADDVIDYDAGAGPERMFDADSMRRYGEECYRAGMANAAEIADENPAPVDGAVSRAIHRALHAMKSSVTPQSMRRHPQQKGQQ